jgi:hypothetical protein
MYRIVDGILLEGKYVPDAWDVCTWEANGHREVSVRNVIAWEEHGNAAEPTDIWGAPDPYIATDAEAAADALLRKQRALKKSAQRAQTMCRRVIKAEGFDELATITYRENQTDRNLAKKHFKEWVRRMRAALGGTFRYCASFEKQERGAMHMHVACHKFPKHVVHAGVKIDGWKLGTQVWRSIVGADNGLVFIGGKKHGVSKRSIRRSPAKMAQYVSKYILKDFEDCPEEKNRYSRSDLAPGGTPAQKAAAHAAFRPTHIRLYRSALADVISAVFECKDGDVMVSHRLGDFGDTYWLCTEPAWIRYNKS